MWCSLTPVINATPSSIAIAIDNGSPLCNDVMNFDVKPARGGDSQKRVGSSRWTLPDSKSGRTIADKARAGQDDESEQLWRPVS